MSLMNSQYDWAWASSALSTLTQSVVLTWRVLVPGPSANLSVQLDDRPAVPWALPSGGVFYRNCPLEKPLGMSAGKHRLTIRLDEGALFKLDYLELVSFVK